MNTNLPPTDPNADHAPKGRRRGNAPAGTKLGQMRPGAVDLAKQLTSRAKNAAIRAKMSQRVYTTITLEIYKATVELSEEYERPITDIVRQCFLDGLRRYKQFRMPYGPFGANAATPFEQAPDLLTPQPQRHADSAASYRDVQEATAANVMAERDLLADFLVPSPTPPGVPAFKPLSTKEVTAAMDAGKAKFEAEVAAQAAPVEAPAE